MMDPENGGEALFYFKGSTHLSLKQNRMSKKTYVLFTPANSLSNKLSFLWVAIILKTEINLTQKKEEIL
jgi:hypothetical protein